MLRKFYEVFDKDFVKNLAFIISRWNYNQRDIKERKNNKVSEETKKQDLN